MKIIITPAISRLCEKLFFLLVLGAGAYLQGYIDVLMALENQIVTLTMGR